MSDHKTTASTGLLLALIACGSGKAGPGSLHLHLNEVVPSNHHSCSDETGSAPDWIELYNDSDEDISLGGYVVADDTDGPGEAERLTDEVIVPAGGVRVLWADDRPDLGPTHLPFRLKATEEKVIVYGPDDGMIDRADWSDAETDVSFARFPDGTGVFVSCAVPTCNALNGAACGTP